MKEHSRGVFFLIFLILFNAMSFGLTIENVGAPVKSVNWIKIFAADAYPGQKTAYVTMGQSPGSFMVLRCDVMSGVFQQINCADEASNFPTTALVSSDGSLYIAAAWSGKLFHLPVNSEQLVDLGKINDKIRFPCAVDQDAEGKIWIGGYPACDLTCYDPVTKKFTEFGRIDDVDMYNYVKVNKDCKIVCIVKWTRPRVVIYDPLTGHKQEAGPVASNPQDGFELVKDQDGWVFLMYKGDFFSVKGNDVQKMDAKPAVRQTNVFGDGTNLGFADQNDLIYRRLKITFADKTTKEHYLDYEGSGSRIFHIMQGPDGIIYGSSYLPLHLFKYNPSTGEMQDLGRASESGGEAYSMAHLDNKIYISAYGDGNLSVYDPKKPCHFGASEDDNPRHLGRIDPSASRPRSTLAGPGGKVWVATIPNYGLWQGPLCYYDPQTQTKKSFQIAGRGSCFTLAWLKESQIMVVGTTIDGGSGTTPKEESAELIFWDYNTEKVISRCKIAPDVRQYDALAVVNGQLYGTYTTKNSNFFIFCFDAKNNKTRWLEKLPARPLELGLQQSPAGKLYGFTQNSIYEIDTNNNKIVEIISEPNGFDVPGPFIGEYLYFSKDHMLKRVKIER